jgi:hypothetical protein
MINNTHKVRTAVSGESNVDTHLSLKELDDQIAEEFKQLYKRFEDIKKSLAKLPSDALMA